MACDEETVSPDDQWSFLRMEIKKKLPPLAGFNPRSNSTTGKYSWGLREGPSILKHPPNRQLRTLGRARDKSCPRASRADPAWPHHEHQQLGGKYPLLSHLPAATPFTFRMPISVKYLGI